MSDLVENLLAAAKLRGGQNSHPKFLRKAADRIKQLETENGQLRDERDAAIRLLREAGDLADKNMLAVEKVKKRAALAGKAGE